MPTCASGSAQTSERSRARWAWTHASEPSSCALVWVSGGCLPKDVQAFIRRAESAGVDFGILKEADRVNKRRIDQFLEKIRRSPWVIQDKQVAVLALAFRPNTDDMRW